VQDEELAAAIREVRERVRTRVSQASPPDLMPLVHARDAAEAKIAAIGTVNPRPPGFTNSIIQAIKRRVARALNWHVREQIEFNRASMACVQAELEAFNGLLAYHQELRSQWDEWRASYEERRTTIEIHLLRTVSELQAAFQHRVTLMEQNFRESIRHMHTEYAAEMERRMIETQKRMWEDIRGAYDELIHRELRVLRQKQAASAYAPAPAAAPRLETVPIDWMRFAETFRGSPEKIRAQQERYVSRFTGAPGQILDLGCGRGEFLEAAREAGLSARGIDQNEECVGLCRSKGLDAECAELFAYVDGLPDFLVGGAFCSQVVEHLSPADVPRLVQLLAHKLRSGAPLVIETPNPECLAIFATHFYLDPTHTRPVPAALLNFYLDEAGFGNIEVERLAPALEAVPALAELPSGFREAFFGGMDYAIFARKL
jgi:2-polyprenyl-3-methyl-5-hydroxy-6-metoxy-1,4-benzoquinol methylase